MKDCERFSWIADDMTKCIVCGSHYGIEYHEIFFGSKRNLSIKYGMVVPLCAECHRGTNGVHGKNGHELDTDLKRKGQFVFEKVYPDLKFIKIFGKNYKE